MGAGGNRHVCPADPPSCVKFREETVGGFRQAAEPHRAGRGRRKGLLRRAPVAIGTLGKGETEVKESRDKEPVLHSCEWQRE